MFGNSVAGLLKLPADLCQMCENLNQLLLQFSIFGFFQRLVLIWRRKLAARFGLLFFLYVFHLCSLPWAAVFDRVNTVLMHNFNFLLPRRHFFLWVEWNFTEGPLYFGLFLSQNTHFKTPRKGCQNTKREVLNSHCEIQQKKTSLCRQKWKAASLTGLQPVYSVKMTELRARNGNVRPVFSRLIGG